MADDPRGRVADQFAGRGGRADVWRLLERVVDADAYLNLGYSRRFQPHLLGSCQRRLVAQVAARVAAELEAPAGARLLDVGCGRGGPARDLAARLGCRVTGVDLVFENVRRAAARARDRTAFVVGDATRLPVADGAVAAATAIDALVYVPERAAALAAVADALASGGVLVFSDLVLAADADDAARAAADAFADAWDMPPLATVPDYRRALGDAGLDVAAVEDLSPHSVGRFRRYTTPLAWLAAGRTRPLVARPLQSRGLDADTVLEQVQRANEALPALRHVLVTAHAPG